MPRPKKIPMPQDVGTRTHITLRISTVERDLMVAAMSRHGWTSMSDFVRHAIAKVSEEYLGGLSAAEQVAILEEEQAALYRMESPSLIAPASLSDVLGVPLFSQPATVPGRGPSRVEAVGLDEPMDGWL